MTFTIKSNKLLDSLIYSLTLALLLLLLLVLSVEFGIGLFFFPTPLEFSEKMASTGSPALV